MKNIYITILLIMFSSVYANEEDCENSTLSAVGPSGTAPQWLFKDANNSINHFREAFGQACAFSIQVNSAGNDPSATAFYTKDHNDPNEVRFRFLLSTENLLQSHGPTSKLVLYTFTYRDAFNVQRPLLKVRLIEQPTPNNGDGWGLKLQWFDTINGGSFHQLYKFNETHDFVEFEFFWKKSIAFNSSSPLPKRTQAGVMLKVGRGFNDTPTFMLSPFNYDEGPHKGIPTLIGRSSLGVINASSDPLQLGDEMRILSPDLYDINNDQPPHNQPPLD